MIHKNNNKTPSPLSIKVFISENFHKPKQEISQTNKPRIDYIDLAKGICIILVVIFHAGYTINTPALKAMRMPLYFILSGLFYKDYDSVLVFIKKKVDRILIPFLFFFIIGLIPSLGNIKDAIVKPFIMPTLANPPIWFLICLFWTNIIYRIISAEIKSTYIKCFIMLCFGIIGYLLACHNIYLPLFLASACSAMPFFYIGSMMRKLPIIYRSERDNIYIMISIIIMICAVMYCIYMGTPFIGFYTNVYFGSIIEIYIVSVAMVVGLLMLCKAVRWLPVISYIGRYSIIVLGLHWICIAIHGPFYFVGLILSNLLRLVLALILSWISIPLCRRFVPFFTAQSDLISTEPKK